jgi:L-2-hydroxyglutarate oxidase LhgO
MKRCDLLIIGGGIVGLTLAREWLMRHPGSTVSVLEKETDSVSHGTGRNSGVVHSGIYYQEQSLRAQLCVAGSQDMLRYVDEKNIWVDRCGKLLVPPTESALASIDVLQKRGITNGVPVQDIDGQEARTLEPRVNTQFDRALYIPVTSVVDNKAVARAVVNDVQTAGGSIDYETQVTGIDAKEGFVETTREPFSAGRIINAAGLFADRVARDAGLEMHYSFQPFKGKYWTHRDPAFRLRRLVYPVPDLNLPFLGVHTAHNANGQVFFGPSSTPVIGRENYHGLDGISWSDGMVLSASLIKKLICNTNGLRTLAWREAKLLRKAGVCAEINRLVSGVRASDLVLSLAKVGIRSQIFDPKAQHLVNDFVILRDQRCIHILNAISPAFTASFAFSRHVLDHYLSE